MVDYEYSDLFKQSSADKQLIIETDDKSVRITNNELHQQKFELEESLCSENQLRFGSCESSLIKFTVSNIFSSLKNKWINVSMVLDNNTNNPFLIGRYKVYSDIPTADKSFREITGYDALYDIINTNIADWYNSLTFPLTLKEFRNSFFNYIEVEQEEVELINDSMNIEKTIDTDELSGKDIICSICEINGCFGHIGRNGKFVYIILAQKAEGLFPSNELYPENSLYPIKNKSESFKENRYISCEYEDYEVQPISKVQIRQEENDIGAISGEGTNCYVVQDNFLLYGKSASELQEIAYNLYYTIKSISYTPFRAVLSGNLCFEVGDAVQFHTKRKIINSYILQRKITGIQTLKDSFSASGEYERFENVNSLNYQIVKLKGKTNTLERNVEETKSTITDVENGLQSQITQTSNSISTKVSKNEVISEINQSSEEVSIKSNKINLNGAVTANQNFNILEDGSIEALKAIINGTIISDDADYYEKRIIRYMKILNGEYPSGLNIYEEGVTIVESGEHNRKYVFVEEFRDENDVLHTIHVSGVGNFTPYNIIEFYDFYGDKLHIIPINNAGETQINIPYYSKYQITMGDSDKAIKLSRIIARKATLHENPSNIYFDEEIILFFNYDGDISAPKVISKSFIATHESTVASTKGAVYGEYGIYPDQSESDSNYFIKGFTQGTDTLYFGKNINSKYDITCKSLTQTSDECKKKDIESLDIQESSDFIYSLRPVKFRFKENESNRYHHGFIAQEVKEAMCDNDWGVYVEDEHGIKGLRYYELIADLIATVKFQDKRISELERRFVNE